MADETIVGPVLELFDEIAGDRVVRVRIIRCTCRPGAWPCECEREVQSFDASAGVAMGIMHRGRP